MSQRLVSLGPSAWWHCFAVNLFRLQSWQACVATVHTYACPVLPLCRSDKVLLSTGYDVCPYCFFLLPVLCRQALPILLATVLAGQPLTPMQLIVALCFVAQVLRSLTERPGRSSINPDFQGRFSSGVAPCYWHGLQQLCCQAMGVWFGSVQQSPYVLIAAYVWHCR